MYQLGSGPWNKLIKVQFLLEQFWIVNELLVHHTFLKLDLVSAAQDILSSKDRKCPFPLAFIGGFEFTTFISSSVIILRGGYFCLDSY